MKPGKWDVYSRSAEWKRAHTLEYRGYRVEGAAVFKGDDVVLAFHVPLDATDEQRFEIGRELIDRLLAT